MQSFSELVRQAFGARDRSQEIDRAFSLIFLREGAEIVGVAALKNPTESKKSRIFQSAGVPEAHLEVPYELGWVVVDGRYRERRHSRRLVESALQAAGDANIFATSHDANTRMHRTLQRCGFTPVGKPYHSRRHGRTLVLFVRSGRSGTGCTFTKNIGCSDWVPGADGERGVS
jgi:predicted GNAT family N-acyltransferase